MADVYTGFTVFGLYDNVTEAPLFAANGTAVPTSSILMGGSDGTNIQPFSVDNTGKLNVNASITPPSDATSTGTLTNPGDTVVLNTSGTSAFFAQITGAAITAGSILFEVTLDGTSWQAFKLYPAVPDGTPSVSSTTTSPSNWTAPVGGIRQIRLRASGTYAGGPSTIFLTAGQGQYGVFNFSDNYANFLATAKITDGTNTAAVTAANALKVDGSAVTQPVSGTVTANQGTSPWVVAPDGTTWTLTGTSANVNVTNTVTVSGTVAVSSVGGTVAVTQSTSPWVVSLASTTITGTVAVTQSTSPWVVAGNLTNNNAAPGTANVGALGFEATSAPLTYTNGNQVLGTTSLGGAVRVVPVDEENASSISYFSVDTGNTLKSVTTGTVFPLISIRSSSASFIYRIREVSGFTDGTGEMIQLIKNPQTLTGSSFAATAPSGSHVTVDTAATAVTIGTGTVVWSGYAASVPAVMDKLMAALAAGAPGDVYTVACQKFGTGTSKAGGQIHWSEQAAAL